MARGDGANGMTITPENMRDAKWRLGNLYRIINRSGQDEVFHPNAVQQDILQRMWYRNLVFKTRKRGTSSLLGIMGLDFNSVGVADL